MAFPIITAQEAAEYVKHGDNLGISGFTAVFPMLPSMLL